VLERCRPGLSFNDAENAQQLKDIQEQLSIWTLMASLSVAKRAWLRKEKMTKETDVDDRPQNF
jgi:hypothetical protein